MEGGKRGRGRPVLQKARKKIVSTSSSSVEPEETESQTKQTTPQCVPKPPFREMRVLLKRYIGPACIRLPLVQVNGNAKSSKTLKASTSKTSKNIIEASNLTSNDSDINKTESPPSKKCKIETECKNSSTSNNKSSKLTAKSIQKSKVKKCKIIQDTKKLDESLITNTIEPNTNSEVKSTNLSEIKDCKDIIENNSENCIIKSDENICKDNIVNSEPVPDLIDEISEYVIQITGSGTNVSDQQSISENCISEDNNLSVNSKDIESAKSDLENTFVNKEQILDIINQPIERIENISDSKEIITDLITEISTPKNDINVEIIENIDIIKENNIRELISESNQEENTDVKLEEFNIDLLTKAIKKECIENCTEITENLPDDTVDNEQSIIIEKELIQNDIKFTQENESSTSNSQDTKEENIILDSMSKVEVKEDEMKVVEPLKEETKESEVSSKVEELPPVTDTKADMDTSILVEDIVIKEEPNMDDMNSEDDSSPKVVKKGARGRGRPRGTLSPRVKREHSPDEYVPDQVIAPVTEMVRTRPVRRIKKPKALCECCSSSSHHEAKKAEAKQMLKTNIEIIPEKNPAKSITKKIKNKKIKPIKIEPIIESEPINTTNNLIESIESDHSYTSPQKIDSNSSTEESPKLQISPISPIIGINNTTSPVNIIKLSLVKTNLNNTKLSNSENNIETKTTSVEILTPEELIKKLQLKLLQQEKEFKIQVEGLQKLASLEKLKADLIHNNMKTQESKFQTELEKERKRCKEYKKQVSDYEKQVSDLKYKVKKMEREHSKCENKITDYLNKKRSFETTLLLYQNKLSVSNTSKCTLKKKVLKYRKQRNKAKIRFMQSTNRKYFSDAESDAEYEKEMTRQREEREERDKKFDQEDLEYSDSSPTVEEMEAQFSDASKLHKKESEVSETTESPCCSSTITSGEEPNTEVDDADNDGSHTPPLPEQVEIRTEEIRTQTPEPEVKAEPVPVEMPEETSEIKIKEDVDDLEQQDLKSCIVDEDINIKTEESPTKKGILIFPGLRERIPGVRKSVIFGDGIKPGEDIDDTQRHRTLSPPPQNKKCVEKIKKKKNKKLRKKRKVELKIELVDDTEEDMTVPPPPPGSPPPQLKQYYLHFKAAIAAGYYYHKDRNVYTPLAQGKQVNKVATSILPSNQTTNGSPVINGSPSINSTNLKIPLNPSLPCNVVSSPRLSCETPPLPVEALKINNPPLPGTDSNPPLPSTAPPQIPPPPPPLPPEDMDIVPPIPPPPNSPPPLHHSSSTNNLPPLIPSATPSLSSKTVPPVLNTKKVIEWNHTAQPSTTRYEDSFISSFQPVLPSTSQESDNNILSPDRSCPDYPSSYQYPYDNRGGFNRDCYNDEELCYDRDESTNFYEPLFPQDRQFIPPPLPPGPYPNDNRHSRFDMNEPIKFRVGFNNRNKNLSWIRPNPKVLPSQDFTSDDPLHCRDEFKMSQLMPQLNQLTLPPPPKPPPKPLLSEIVEPPVLNNTSVPPVKPLMPNPFSMLWMPKNKKKKKKKNSTPNT